MGQRKGKGESTEPSASTTIEEERGLIAAAGDREDLVSSIVVMAESRRGQADQLMWQIPALSLTAQAFLTSAIFSTTTGDVGRVIASLTASVFVGAALQSLLKHRYDEGVWSRWLKVFEEHHRLPSLNTPSRRETVALAGDEESPATPSWLYGLPIYVLNLRIFGWTPFSGSAFRVWAVALASIVALDLCLVVLSSGDLLGCWSIFPGHGGGDHLTRIVIR